MPSARRKDSPCKRQMVAPRSSKSEEERMIALRSQSERSIPFSAVPVRFARINLVLEKTASFKMHSARSAQERSQPSKEKDRSFVRLKFAYESTSLSKTVSRKELSEKSAPTPLQSRQIVRRKEELLKSALEKSQDSNRTSQKSAPLKFASPKRHPLNLTQENSARGKAVPERSAEFITRFSIRSSFSQAEYKILVSEISVQFFKIGGKIFILLLWREKAKKSIYFYVAVKANAVSRLTF